MNSEDLRLKLNEVIRQTNQNESAINLLLQQINQIQVPNPKLAKLFGTDWDGQQIPALRIQEKTHFANTYHWQTNGNSGKYFRGDPNEEHNQELGGSILCADHFDALYQIVFNHWEQPIKLFIDVVGKKPHVFICKPYDTTELDILIPAHTQYKITWCDMRGRNMDAIMVFGGVEYYG